MSNVERISLKKRLESVESDENVFLPVFDIFAEDYFNELVSITGDEKYRNIYEKEVRGYEKVADTQYFLNELVSVAECKSEKADFLYRTLIEPFSVMKD